MFLILLMNLVAARAAMAGTDPHQQHCAAVFVLEHQHQQAGTAVD